MDNREAKQVLQHIVIRLPQTEPIERITEAMIKSINVLGAENVPENMASEEVRAESSIYGNVRDTAEIQEFSDRP